MYSGICLNYLFIQTSQRHFLIYDLFLAIIILIYVKNADITTHFTKFYYKNEKSCYKMKELDTLFTNHILRYFIWITT